MNEFTLMLANKGWKVGEACQYWGLDYKTWLRMRSKEKSRNKLTCLIKGLPERDINKLAEIIKGND